MAVVHVRFECRECPFVTTDGGEAEEHADTERHCVEVSGEIQPRVAAHLNGAGRAGGALSSNRGPLPLEQKAQP